MLVLICCVLDKRSNSISSCSVSSWTSAKEYFPPEGSNMGGGVGRPSSAHHVIDDGSYTDMGASQYPHPLNSQSGTAHLFLALAYCVVVKLCKLNVMLGLTFLNIF